MSGRGPEQDGGPSSFPEIKISMGNSLDLTLPLNPEDLISEVGTKPPGLRMTVAPKVGGKFTIQQVEEIADGFRQLILFHKRFAEQFDSFDRPPTSFGPLEEEEEKQEQLLNYPIPVVEDMGGKRVSGYTGEIMTVDISPSPDKLPEDQIPTFVLRLKEEMIKTLGLDAE